MGDSVQHTNGTNKSNKAESKWKSRLNKPQKILGVEFAPINVPWERRKQTTAVVCWSILFFLTGPGGWVILISLCFTPLLPLAVLYFSWIVYDRNTCNVGSREQGFFKNWILWKYYKKFFPIVLVKTAELDPKKSYLLASHPHGILASGTFVSFATDANQISKLFPGITFNLVTLPLNFWIPFYRELCLGHGLCSAKRESMNFLLQHPKKGRGIVLVPGGAPESLFSHPGSNVVQLKSRKGFIKVALQNGASLVPIYCFGETDIYNQLENPEGSFIRKLQDKATEIFTFAPPIFSGRGIFQYSYGVLPKRHPIFVVVGSPIEVDLCDSPTQDQIDSLHSKYVEALKKLFDENKDKYTDPDAELTII